MSRMDWNFFDRLYTTLFNVIAGFLGIFFPLRDLILISKSRVRVRHDMPNDSVRVLAAVSSSEGGAQRITADEPAIRIER